MKKGLDDMKIKKDQSGITLIEALASIVIVTIILLSFFYIFFYATKSTRASNEIFDATYYAQKEMEYLYQLSQTVEHSNWEQAITHVPQVPDESWEQHEAKRIYYYNKLTHSTIYEKLGNVNEDPNNH